MIFLSCVLFALLFPIILVRVALKVLFSLFEKGIDQLLDLIFGWPEKLIEGLKQDKKTNSKKMPVKTNTSTKKPAKKKDKKPIKVISKK